VYNVLEDVVRVILVNAVHIKNLPGKKTDIADSKWLAGLLRHGLLKGSFIPPEYVRDWRDLARMRKGIQEHLADYKRRIHKVFESANIKLGSVLSDIFGVTGRQLMNLLISPSADITLADIEACIQGRLKSDSARCLTGHQRVFPGPPPLYDREISPTNKQLRTGIGRLGSAADYAHGVISFPVAKTGGHSRHQCDFSKTYSVRNRSHVGSVLHQCRLGLLVWTLPGQQSERGQTSQWPQSGPPSSLKRDHD
jgi:hypothetical protein